MPRDFIPRRDADFLAFSVNFGERISASPTSYGLSVTQAAHYALTQEAFAAAYDAASRPGTRTIVAVRAKNDARDVLEAETRALAGIIRAHPGVTESMLCDLHMETPARARGGRRKRVPAPTVAPALHIKSVQGAMINVQLVDSQSGRVGKPRDCVGAAVMGFVGDDYPDDPLQWTLVRQTSKTRLRLTVGLPPGQKIWLAACWLGTRAQRGPFSAPMSTHVSHWGAGPMIHARRGLPQMLRFANPTLPAAGELKQAA